MVTDDDKEHLSLVADVFIEGAPKKLIKGNNTESPLLSINAVLSNYDLLFDILLRLPVLSLVLFTSVSKYWSNIIKSPRFIASRTKIPNIDPPSALLIRRIRLYDFESFDVRIPSKKLTVFPFASDAPRGYVYVVQSCNGLLLCCIHPYEFYVYNPTTKLFKMIPTNSPTRFARIAFDPTKSPHYKVIQPVYVGNGLGGYQVHTYSSETGIWSVSDDYFDFLTFDRFDKGVYCNDAIHWLDRASSKNALHIKLDIANEQPVLTSLELPVNFDGKSCYESKLFESRGFLLLLGKDQAHSRQRNVFELRSNDSEWSLKFIVNLDDIRMPLPRTWMTWHVWSIVLGEREVDSFMIIDVLNKVVQYNPVSKTAHTLTDLDCIEPVYDFRGFQFIPSFAGV